MSALTEKFEPVLDDLTYVESKLAEELGTETAPGELLERLARVEAALESLRERHAAVTEAKKDVLGVAASVARPLAQRLAPLDPGADGARGAAGCAAGEVAALDSACKALGVVAQQPRVQPVATAAMSCGPRALAVDDLEMSARRAPLEEVNGAGAGAAKRREDVPRSAARWFVPLTQTEFESVSELTRGRLTVDAVNTVYEKIYDLFQTNPSRPPLSTKKMAAMGLAVTGASGKAKITVLRALKLVDVSSAGVSLNKSAHKRRRV